MEENEEGRMAAKAKLTGRLTALISFRLAAWPEVNEGYLIDIISRSSKALSAFVPCMVAKNSSLNCTLGICTLKCIFKRQATSWRRQYFSERFLWELFSQQVKMVWIKFAEREGEKVREVTGRRWSTRREKTGGESPIKEEEGMKGWFSLRVGEKCKRGEGGMEKDSSTIFEWDYRNDFQCFDKKTVLLLFPQTPIAMDFITLISFTDLFRLQLIAFSELKNKNLNQIGILWEEYG